MSSIAQILLDKWAGNTIGLKEDYRSRLSHGVWTVEFTKVDGTAAIMECTLDPKLLPPPHDHLPLQQRFEHDDLLSVYAIDRNGWRSFKVANVKACYPKPESL